MERARRRVQYNLKKYGSASALTIVVSLLFYLGLVKAEGQSPAPAKRVGLEIVLDSVPADTPKDAVIYVAGSFNGWQPGDPNYRLTPRASGKYAVILAANIVGPIEFKFNLGSWDNSELQAGGEELANRQTEIHASSDGAYRGTVAKWKRAAENLLELQKALESILAQTRTPGVSVTIVRKGRVEWAAGLGLANRAAKRKANTDTLFRIGSVSKGFAALAILQLVEAGRLNLQDRVRELVPEVEFDNQWEDTDPVRVVDLLEHTTGWDDLPLKAYGNFPSQLGLRPALEYAGQSRVSRWRPGTRMAYCNSGPAVAALIVEKLSGQRFEDYVQQALFDPIGMRSATYFEASEAQASTLYYADGTSVVPYRNVLFRPSGAINASASDMAAYLAFLQQRGRVNGLSVLPEQALYRMETPTRNWGSQQGLTTGYGLYSFSSIDNGVLYQGHDGATVGGLTALAYRPDHGVGYFYSINAWNGEAFQRIGDALRAYIARDLLRPVPPAQVALPVDAQAYVGWYEPASPRNAGRHFVHRLLALTHLRIDSGRMHLKALNATDSSPLIPVTGKLLRFAPDPVATVALVDHNKEGTFIVVGEHTWKRVPGWLVALEVAAVAWFALALIGTLLYAPFWVLRGCATRCWTRTELPLKAWPLVALASLVLTQLVPGWAGEQSLVRLGQLTVYSGAVWLASLMFAAASIGTVIALGKAQRRGVRGGLLAYSACVAAGLVIATVYLAYWGQLGARSWA